MVEHSLTPLLCSLQKSYPQIRLLILFGSLAKNAGREESDIDLGVGVGRALNVTEKMEIITTLAEATGRPVDLVDLATVGEPLLGQILQHGVRIVGSNNDYANLLKKHLFEQADFVPYQQRILAERRQAWLGTNG